MRQSTACGSCELRNLFAGGGGWLRHPLAWEGSCCGSSHRGALPATARSRGLCLYGVQHPCFDFSGAEFNGSAPDPRFFQGGMPGGL